MFDENNIIDLLSMPVNRDNANAMKAGAAQTIVDLYDRKVTREEFCVALEPVLNLYSYIGRLSMLAAIHDTFDKGALTDTAFIEANEVIVKLVRAHCQQTVELVRRLKECPTGQDKVH